MPKFFYLTRTPSTFGEPEEDPRVLVNPKYIQYVEPGPYHTLVAFEGRSLYVQESVDEVHELLDGGAP